MIQDAVDPEATTAVPMTLLPGSPKTQQQPVLLPGLHLASAPTSPLPLPPSTRQTALRTPSRTGAPLGDAAVTLEMPTCGFHSHLPLTMAIQRRLLFPHPIEVCLIGHQIGRPPLSWYRLCPPGSGGR